MTQEFLSKNKSEQIISKICLFKKFISISIKWSL
jgi:hypothetical protein